MISKIYIERFKCFDAIELALGQLTLLTGYNAAGKSSSIQPLLLLAQALRQLPIDTVLPLSGPLVRLGSAGDVVNANVNGDLMIRITDKNTDSVTWAFAHDRDLGRQELRLKYSQYPVEGRREPHWIPVAPNSLIAGIRDVIFLGAVRDPFNEAQPYPDNPSLVMGDVGVDGRYAGYWFVRQADEEVPLLRRHPHDSRVTVRAQVEAWLGELFPGASVNATEIEGLALAKVEFRVGKGSDWRRPANVGYGLSYAFPILVALMCAMPGQIFIVDSPEAHLHPSAQSAMGHILAHFAAAGVQVIIESHSDHLLSGVRLAVRRKRLPAVDVAIHFFAARGADGQKPRGSVNAQEPDVVKAVDIGRQQLTDLLSARTGVPDQQQHEEKAIVNDDAARFETLLFRLTARPWRQGKNRTTLLDRDSLP
ncbi:putative ATPase [Sphingobium sp. B7D2B]|uniref:AAA family ATPase n=1 Tax=Sphingobium sp. B7D2B TaxID=2940583 RepID=UPI002225941D|nr:AAA family ATPase [Sphingobium sp. B7D2B]MCW2365964.1 putative ATPase [Sphingobium sp. B7D2B]